MDEGGRRRLATIVAIDVAGFSARTEADAVGAVADMAVVGALIANISGAHGGRIFNTAGDGFMLEFGEVSGAVEAAEALAAQAKPPIRAGVHLGEVWVMPSGDLLGHGVNVAARLQAMAPKGGILVSADVRRAIHGPLAARLRSRGKVRLEKMNEVLEVFVLEGGAANALWHPPRRARSGRPSSKRSICVMPFVNMSGDADQEYFSDGISEDIITDLSKVSALFVVARNTAFTFKGKSVEVTQVARQLNVGHVLEGSVRKAGGRVRISAQLIDGSTGGHVWAERYDRDLTDIFALQDEISQAIVRALKLKLLPEEKQAIERRGTDSVDAYDLYLMARQYWVSGNRGDSRREEAIVRLCRRAVEIDPAYARAWALMGLAQADLRMRHGSREFDSGVAVERALTLDPNLAEAHALNAAHLRNEMRLDEAAEAVEIALRLDAESFEVNRAAAAVKFGQQRLAEAVAHYDKAAALMETDFNSPAMAVTCYTALGDAEAATQAARTCLARCEMALARDRGNGAALGSGARTLAALKEAERARDWVGRALLVDPDNQNMRYNLACALSLYLEDIEGAFELIGPWFARTSGPWLEHAKVDPDFDPIREDPRFRAMIAQAEARLATEAAATV